MKNHKKKILILMVIIVAISANYSRVYSLFIGEKDNVQKEETLDLGLPVESSKVVKEELVDTLTVIGTIFPKETVEVITKVPAQIKEILVKDGDLVKKGQVIARLEDENINAKLTTTQAKIDTIKFNLNYLMKEEERYLILAESGGIPQSTYEKISHEKGMVEMQLKELYASKDEIMVSLKDTILLSTMDGKVRAVNSTAGDLAITGKPIVVIDDISELIVKTKVSESDLEKIKTGTPVSMKISGIDERIGANVTGIVSSVDPKTRIGEVEIGNLKLNENKNIILGTSVETQFIINKIEEGLTIPTSAVKQLNHKQVVYKVEENYVKEISILTGLRIGNKIQVVEGLAEGDEVIVENIDKLYDKAKVYLFRREQE